MLEGLSGGIVIALVDFVMVFLILGGLMLAIRGLKRLVESFEKPPVIAEPQAKAVIQEPITPAPVGIPQTHAHIAAIAAALYEFTSMPEGSLRIVNIQEAGAASSAWKLSGRLDF